MQAIVIHEFGGPDVLRLEDVPQPHPGEREVRVRVHATFVARTRDISTRTGRHPYSREMRLPHILGGEHAGTVDAVGEGVDSALIGARVAVSSHLPCGDCPPCRSGRDEGCRQARILGVHRNGAYAEYCVAPAANVHRFPDDVGFAQAAAMAANGAVGTAQLDAGAVGQGTWLAIPGASGALGRVLVGLAAGRGAHVLGLTRDAASAPLIEALGAHAVVDTNRADLADELIRLTAGNGVDVVIDNVAVADLFARYMPALATTGRVVLSGALAFDPLPVDARSLYVNSQAIVGVRTGNRGKIERFWEAVSGGYRLPAEGIERFPLERVAAAHAALTNGGFSGPVVLDISSGPERG